MPKSSRAAVQGHQPSKHRLPPAVQPRPYSIPTGSDEPALTASEMDLTPP
jgi:hypothetical protein